MPIYWKTQQTEKRQKSDIKGAFLIVRYFYLALASLTSGMGAMSAGEHCRSLPLNWVKGKHCHSLGYAITYGTYPLVSSGSNVLCCDCRFFPVWEARSRQWAEIGTRRIGRRCKGIGRRWKELGGGSREELTPRSNILNWVLDICRLPEIGNSTLRNQRDRS